jgi:hypothetical protein
MGYEITVNRLKQFDTKSVTNLFIMRKVFVKNAVIINGTRIALYASSPGFMQ